MHRPPPRTATHRRLPFQIAALAALAAAPAAAAQSVRADHVEVVQVIQDSSGKVPLLAGKRTAVRVFLSGTYARAVRGSLQVHGPTGALVGTYPSTRPTTPAPGGTALRERRQRSDASLNFVIPAEAVRLGAAKVELASVTDAATGAPVACANCPRVEPVRFMEAPVLRVLLVRYRYDANGQAKITPRDADLRAAAEWIHRTFPIRHLQVAQRTVDANPGWKGNCAAAEKHLAEIRASDMLKGADRRTHYLAVVSDQALPGFAGCSSFIPPGPDPGAVAIFPAGKSHPHYPWDTDGSYADWYSAHELAHTLGRRHRSGCGAVPDDGFYPYSGATINNPKTSFVGWDVDAELAYGNRARDLMTYCESPWPSAYTYDLLYNRLRDEERIFAPLVPKAQGVVFAFAPMQPPPAAVVAPDTSRWMTLLGTINLTTRKGLIEAIVDAPPTSVGRAEAPDSVTLQLRDGGGAVLARFPVRLRPSHDPGGKLPGRAFIQEDILVDARARRLDLVLNDTVLDSLSVSRSAPRIRTVEREPDSADDALVFTWDAADADGTASLSYTVLVWFDNEEVPETMAAGLRKERIEIDSAQRDGRTITRIEIVASDGLRVDRYRSGRLP